MRSTSLDGATAGSLRERYGAWALITGASSGIGEGFARALAREGLGVVLVARRKELLDRIAHELESKLGAAVRTVAMDLASDGAAQDLAERVRDLEVGVVVNNAGTGWIGRFDKQTAAEHSRLVHLHCVLPVELTSLLLGPMETRGRGAIIVVASAGAYVSMPYYAVYGGTKAFLAMWGEALGAEVKARGIDVLVLAPGDTKTGFQEVAGEMSTRWSSVEEVVEPALAGLGKHPVVVPGLENKAGLLISRFLPRALVVKMMERRQREQTPESRR
jgi:short-subunit dehydrogenase